MLDPSTSERERDYLLLRLLVGKGLVLQEDNVPTPENFLVDRVPHSVAELIIAIAKEYAWSGLWIQLSSPFLSNMHVCETPEYLQMFLGILLCYLLEPPSASVKFPFPLSRGVP